jgi:glycosyltransferase involved in cell wall biosynthesis
LRRGVAVAAAVVQRPHVGGHSWVALQWLLGFRALGWDVVLVDRLDHDMWHDRSGGPCQAEDSVNVEYLADVMRRFGLGDSWAILVAGRDPIGLSRRALERKVGSSEVLLNVMGYLDDEDLLARAPLRVFLDIDPGFGQMWRALGLHDAFAGHDGFVTFGLRLGQAACGVPDCGLDWIPTLPPVVLDEWPSAPGGDAFSTVASWRGPFGPIDYDGRRFGLRVHEFRRFLELPRITGAAFRLALDIDAADGLDRDQLLEHGWELVDPRSAAGDPIAYRDFIQRSGAELNVAKNLYVDTRGGWFSDRSACYLASGKPVLAQDTGFGDALPVGEGLLAFASVEEAAAGVEAIRRDPARHAAAARRIAEEHLDAERVIGRLMNDLGVA